MRFLKTKISISQKFRQENILKDEMFIENSPVETTPQVDTSITSPEDISSVSTTSKRKERRKIEGGHITPENIRCAKNIAKNYGRAISNFASTKLAEPYLLPILKQEGVELQEFVEYMKSTKSGINGIDTFRAMLLIKNTDSDKIAAYKRVFREMGKIFINYFSVNWIYGNSKIVHRLTYLKFRFKILRRIENPELFTYLKG